MIGERRLVHRAHNRVVHLSRKQGQAFATIHHHLATKMNDTIVCAMHEPALADHAQALARALQRVGAATKSAWSTGNPTEALANATPYLQAFGHMVLAWVWLDLAMALPGFPHPNPLPQGEGTSTQDALGAQSAFVAGKLAAMRYFFHYELPKIDAWLAVVSSRDLTCANLAVDCF